MNRIINLGILAHVDAGKTTVTEGLLVHSGVKRQMGRVDSGTTTTDSMALERQRGMTIRAATVSFHWNDTKINLIDTPGHMDFIAEVERSLSVLDGVVLVVSAKEGVQPQTRVIFRKLRAMGIPTLLFVNKIDRIGVSLPAVYENLRALLTDRIIPMQTAVGEGERGVTVSPLLHHEGRSREMIIEGSDALLARYLADEEISTAQLDDALVSQTRQGSLFPVYLGAALHDIGTEPLLTAITTFFTGFSNGSEPLSGVVYKVEWDGGGRKRAYVRLFSGALALRDKVPIVGAEEPLFVRGLMAVNGSRFDPAERIDAGDIGVILDAPFLKCGDHLGCMTARPGGSPPAPPLMSAGISPANAADRPALLNALQRLTEEDPFLRLSIHSETGEICVRIFGPLQREILEALLLERFGLNTIFAPLQTLYKVKPAKPASAEMRIWQKENLHEAGIALMVEPLPPDSGTVYETKVSLGDLEKPYQNGVQDGVRIGLAEGLGDEIVDTKVTFIDMDYSSVTSTPADYRRLAPLVLRKALIAAGQTRLEPWLRILVIAPLSSQKKVLTAVNRLRATMGEVTYDDAEFTVRGEAPLDTCKAFSAELLSMTQGKGIFSSEFMEYREI